MMSDLPSYSVRDNVTPFSTTRIDYFEPFVVKMFRKTVKRWICLFTCLSVRAVHLDVVHSLDTQSCLDAIYRFTARRGKPRSIFSDNWTIFVGVANQLRKAFELLYESQMNETLAIEGVDWQSNPAGAPQFGGAWESLVKSTKRAMFNVLGKEEKLNTIVCLTEQQLNRPLTPVSVNIDDLHTITPSLFLIAGPNYYWPQWLMSDKNVSYRKMFRTVTEQLKHSWKRWMTECLPTLQQRKKRYSSGNSVIKEGDLVWIVDERDSYFIYSLGRIQAIHRGDDQVIRSTTIETLKGIFKRPIIKLIPLELDRSNLCWDPKWGRLCCDHKFGNSLNAFCPHWTNPYYHFSHPQRVHLHMVH